MRFSIFLSIITIILYSTPSSYSQTEEIGFRMVREKVGEIDGKVYFAIEKPREVNGEKAIRTDRDEHKALIVFNERGFLFHQRLDQLKDFPLDFKVIKSFVFQNSIYTLTGKKENGNAEIRLIQMNEKLEISDANYLSVNFSGNLEELQAKLVGNQLAILSKNELLKKKENNLQLIGIDLVTKRISESKTNVITPNNLVLSDLTINSDLSIHAVYYSIEHSAFENIDNFTTVFIQLNNSKASYRFYNYSLNQEYIPSSYKFLKLTENEFYVLAIAHPTKGANTGYFLCENKFNSEIDFEKSKVLISDDFLNSENWNNEDYKQILKSKSPFKYGKYQLKDAIISNGRLNFVSIEAGVYGYYTNNSTMNASSASTTGGPTSAHSPGGTNESLEKNIVFASFDLDSFKSVGYFKTLNKESTDLFDFNFDFTFYEKENEFIMLFRTNKFSDEFGLTKKELNFSMMNASEIVKLTYNFEEKSKKYSLLKSLEKKFYHSLELGFILEGKIYFLSAEKILQLSRIEKNKLEVFDL